MEKRRYGEEKAGERTVAAAFLYRLGVRSLETVLAVSGGRVGTFPIPMLWSNQQLCLYLRKA